MARELLVETGGERITRRDATISKREEEQWVQKRIAGERCEEVFRIKFGFELPSEWLFESACKCR